MSPPRMYRGCSTWIASGITSWRVSDSMRRVRPPWTLRRGFDSSTKFILPSAWQPWLSLSNEDCSGMNLSSSWQRWLNIYLKFLLTSSFDISITYHNSFDDNWYRNDYKHSLKHCPCWIYSALVQGLSSGPEGDSSSVWRACTRISCSLSVLRQGGRVEVTRS